MQEAEEPRPEAASILRDLGALFPGFQEHWLHDGNLFRELDGSYTLCGVFCDFTDYFRSRHATFSSQQLAALGQILSHCMRIPESDAGNAAATCFLENIAGDPCDRVLQPHLDATGREFLEQCGGPDRD